VDAYFGGAGARAGIVAEAGAFEIGAPAIPGNLYWLERSADLIAWSFEPWSVTTLATFGEDSAAWLVPGSPASRHFWRVGGGWPDRHGLNLLANGLDGLAFVGGSAGWTYDPATGILRHDTASPSSWVHFGPSHSDFMLHLEYRLSSGGNGGVFLRAAVAGDPWLTGSEIQITNEDRLPVHSTGAVYDRIPADPPADARHSVWHRMDILIAGHRLRVRIDGIPVVDAADVRDVVPGFAWPSSGHIGLQNSHASIPGTVEYRNLRLIPLVP
jgi:hypothetical protein